MSEFNDIDPDHATKRAFLRVVGPMILAVGILFMVIGGIDFFSSFEPFEQPHLFWCFFVGMPLLFVGGVISMLGYMGAIARYQAGEIAPVGSDTANYVAPLIAPAIKSMASAVAKGIEQSDEDVFCARCDARNETDANYCKACGHALKE